MTVRVDVYRLVLRFPRLFPDPTLFEDPLHLANRYLTANGVPGEKSDLVCQITEEILPVDDRGAPSSTSGTAKYPFEGKMILAEFMSNANLPLNYVDFGTGLSSDEHSKLWTKGKLGELRFELHEFKHQTQTLNIPDTQELYQILKQRADPNTLSTVELDSIPEHMFRPTLALVENKLRTATKADGLDVEVYAARDLSASEKAALEKRLTRESGKATIFVILSRPAISRPIPTAK
jgi:hypothetical protein